jgi:hypothetical protein
MADLGIRRWAFLPFAENFAPLFKVLWGGAVILFHGSYMSLLALLWFTHFAITVTFGSILRRIGFGLFSTGSAMLMCALPWMNIETLAWSVQWSPMLATFFFLLSWRLLIHIVYTNKWNGLVIGKITLYGVLLIASALCFSRGVIGGFVLAVYVTLSSRPGTLPTLKRAVLGTSCAIPAIIGALVYAPVMLNTSHAQQLHGHYSAIFEFTIYSLLLNPLFRVAWWEMPFVGFMAATTFGLFKMAVVFSGFSAARRSREQVALLGAFVLFDITNCALLGVGRFHTGIQMTVGSRYQYFSLLCLAPFLGLLMSRAWVKHSTRLDKAAAAALLLASCSLLTYRWPQELGGWSAWRGTDVRTVIELKGNPIERFASSLQNSVRAAELQAKYNLH